MALTWPGVPVTAWASMRPPRSKIPADRSPASRTVVEKAVRMSAWACSSTIEIMRFQMTWRRSSGPVAAGRCPVSARASAWPSLITRSPRPLIVTLAADGTTVVVWSSTTRAGPSIVMPGARSPRRKTTASSGPSQSGAMRLRCWEAAGGGISSGVAGVWPPAGRGAATVRLQVSASMSRSGTVRPYWTRYSASNAERSAAPSIAPGRSAESSGRATFTS